MFEGDERVKPGGNSGDAGSERGDLIAQCEIERVEWNENLRSSMNERGDAVIEFESKVSSNPKNWEIWSCLNLLRFESESEDRFNSDENCF